MKQAVMIEPGKIEFRDVDIPKINPDEVLIKTHRIGICGSDIHVYHGKHPYTSYPIVQGHEISGEIAKVGENVQGLKEGDLVTVMPQVVCGECYPCLHDQYHICDNLKVLGFQTTGTASEYFKINAASVLKTDSITDLNDIAFIEPVAVAVHALGRLGDISGKKILVLGAGPIGNLIGQAAKALGAQQVMITDVSDFRLELAAKCNIDHCINTQKVDLGSALVEKFGHDKADCILDCAGVSASIDAAISNARKGSDIVVVAVFSKKESVDLGLIQDRELRLIGTLMYKKEDFLKAIDIIAKKQINIGILVTNTFGFDEFSDAYEFIEKQKDQAMKIIVQLD